MPSFAGSSTVGVVWRKVDVFKTPINLHIDVVNSGINGKILDWFKLKAFADDKINVTEKLKFVLERQENIVGKGENTGYQHFLLFPQCFQKPDFGGSSKSGLCGKELKGKLDMLLM